MRRLFGDTEGHYAMAFPAGWGVLSEKKWPRIVEPSNSGVNNFFRLRLPFRPLSATQVEGQSPKSFDPHLVRQLCLAHGQMEVADAMITPPKAAVQNGRCWIKQSSKPQSCW